MQAGGLTQRKTQATCARRGCANKFWPRRKQLFCQDRKCQSKRWVEQMQTGRVSITVEAEQWIEKQRWELEALIETQAEEMRKGVRLSHHVADAVSLDALLSEDGTGTFSDSLVADDEPFTAHFGYREQGKPRGGGHSHVPCRKP